eukprot:364635-Chlamydomonas_euryale.AAC.12
MPERAPARGVACTFQCAPRSFCAAHSARYRVVGYLFRLANSSGPECRRRRQQQTPPAPPCAAPCSPAYAALPPCAAGDRTAAGWLPPAEWQRRPRRLCPHQHSLCPAPAALVAETPAAAARAACVAAARAACVAAVGALPYAGSGLLR